MLPWSKNDRPVPKCQNTHTILPGHIDAAQLPQRRKPFSTLTDLKWCHTIDIVLPQNIHDSIQDDLSHLNHVRYARVMMKLEDVITGDFFNKYLRSGNISMLSEGRSGIDNRYSLREGVLSLYLDHATYERAGLQGKAIADGGLKHKKNRYQIDINLRLPSMIHGKRGFDRLVWAAKNVLNGSLTWLFIDGSSHSAKPAPAAVANGVTAADDPIERHHPRWFDVTPAKTTLENMGIPYVIRAVPFESVPADAELSAELEEWLSLMMLGSPVLSSSIPKPDPYICRYNFPITIDMDVETPQANYTNVVRLRWMGFMSSAASMSILILLMKTLRGADHSQSGPMWIGLQAHGFENETVSLLMRSGPVAECLEWMYKKA